MRVKVPAALDSVLLWPLELAHAGGKPLAAQGDVTLVYDIAPDAPPRRKNEVGATLRMLAVFSQPTKTSVLALRRERYALTQLIRRIVRERAMVELQVVQYGVTRKRLEKIADSARRVGRAAPVRARCGWSVRAGEGRRFPGSGAHR